MTKEETIKVLRSIEDRAVDFPHMTACDWVAIASAKRHLTNSMEEKNKKLRLLVTTCCPNHCPLCCNNRFDFDKLPVVDRWDYDEIMITGGEPLLFALRTSRLVDSIRGIQGTMGIKPSKIYVYTAKALYLPEVLPYLSGVVYTPHSRRDLDEFICVNENLRLRYNYKNLSLRLNLFPDIKAMLPKNVDLSLWQVKDMEWIKDCPVPEGEDFRRIAKLWEI